MVFDALDWKVDRLPLTLLGPNGAGKSTLLAVLGGTLLPSRGVVTTDVAGGLDVQSRAWARHVGLAPQHFRGLRGLTVREVIAYAGWLKGMSRTDAWQASETAIDVAALAALASRASSQLSGGELRRLALAQAVVHSPRLLLLDEIDAGLDAAQRIAVRAAVERLSERTAVISATHELVSIPGGDHAVAIIDGGRIVFEGNAAEFFARAPDGTALHQVAEAAYLAVTERVRSPQ
ncbi:ATP-binding cassette domain-containing protein [Agrococcus sp. KRD186]|uniref:ATP-binding cassette domain-containing protein n=1 Tax=Agrococcus sp. KRD186 TaxID=2729730 RepID=UPI0019D31D4D|nr:ATP-binding cassette domain-containing protein [Agrococcus sp. KRD186]